MGYKPDNIQNGLAIFGDKDNKTYMSMDDKRFAFGKKWESFVKEALNERRIDIATEHLKDFLDISLKGKYCLDIGCGSGIHSLAAQRLGAGKIVSFDYDHDSVRTTKAVCERF